MSPEPIDPNTLEAVVDANAALAGLRLTPAQRPGVLQFFALAAAMAQTVFAVPLARDDEPGAVWQPAEPGARDERG